MTARLQQLIAAHGRCDGWPGCAFGTPGTAGVHVSLSDAERGELRAWLGDGSQPGRDTPTARAVPAASRGPSAEQLRGFRTALEKLTGRGRWSHLSPHILALPDFELRWIDPDHAEPGFPLARANASTSIFKDGSVVICLRLDHDEAQVHRSALHELAHLVDVALLKAGYPDHYLEARAAETVARYLSC